MNDLAQILTDRLGLRRFRLDEWAALQSLANDRAIASTTLTMPFPYDEGFAKQYLLEDQQLDPDVINLAIALRGSDELIGNINCRINRVHGSGEIGFWIGSRYRGHGYAQEAVTALIQHGFDVQRLNRVHGAHFEGNHASGRVLLKCGMTQEGTLRQAVQKDGRFLDLIEYSILKGEYDSKRA